jgi:RNA polymerase sigma factor (sigma-70 family)
MATSKLSRVLEHVRSIVDRQEAESDGRLLELFMTQRDERAFEALVRRHGPMVLGVCQRVLRNFHDAEEAFQATFLVLVRKAASVRPRELVGNWLYGVACRTALEARRAASKRRAKERQVVAMPQPEKGNDTWEELRFVLDQELARLPNKYRAVLVLCDLEGKTRKDAARKLAVPEGTVASRLASARTLLAKRLSRHGFAVSGGALAALLSQNASASVPPSVIASTIHAASLFAAGQATATGVISVQVAALTEGVVKAMLLTKLKISTAMLLVAVLVALGAGVGLSQGPTAPRTTDKSGARDSSEATQAHQPAPPTKQDLDKLFKDLEQSPKDLQIEFLKEVVRFYRQWRAMLENDASLAALRSSQVARTPARWEYKAITTAAIEQLAARGVADRLTDGLNKLGSEGWELVAVESGSGPASHYVFKRLAATSGEAKPRK